MTLKEQLLFLLIEEEQEDLYRAVIDNTSNLLSSDKKELLSQYGLKVRQSYNNSRPNVRNSMVEVTTSGWGNETDTTLPGIVISSSERR